MTITIAKQEKPIQKLKRSNLPLFASVKLTVTLLVLIATTVLIGAWCPQESQVGQQKVIDQFGEELALTFHNIGISDIFHTPWFLALIALLTINMIACSVQRVFPKLRLLKLPLPWLEGDAIAKLPSSRQISMPMLAEQTINNVEKKLKGCGYVTRRKDNYVTAEWGKIGKLAPTITHIGLLTLLAGVTITSWTGFSGFQMVAQGKTFSLQKSDHSNLWIGHLPKWDVRLDSSWKESYPTGEPKQWYSQLSVLDKDGHVLKRQLISVNSPLTYQNVDIYQSNWALDSLDISFNGHDQKLKLQPMGKTFAAFLPLTPDTVLIFSVRGQKEPLRLFGKTSGWDGPRLLAQLPCGGSCKLGDVLVSYKQLIPLSGLQYKCDPGLPVTYVAFGFIITGVLLASVPHRQLWAYAQDNEMNKQQLSSAENTVTCSLFLGGRAQKARTAFEKGLDVIAQKLRADFERESNV